MRAQDDGMTVEGTQPHSSQPTVMYELTEWNIKGVISRALRQGADSRCRHEF